MRDRSGSGGGREQGGAKFPIRERILLEGKVSVLSRPGLRDFVHYIFSAVRIQGEEGLDHECPDPEGKESVFGQEGPGLL